MPESELWLPSGAKLAREGELRPRGLDSVASRALAEGLKGPIETDMSQVVTMGMSRRASVASGSQGLTNTMFASGRPKDPMWYWEQNNSQAKSWNDPEEMAKIRNYCNTPDAPVWMADFSFKEIGQIAAGEEVIGWEMYQTDGGTWKKRLVRTKVLATQRRIAPEVVKITMESGRVIRCTPDHQWANPLYSRGAKDVRPGVRWADEYLPAQIGRELSFVIEPTPEIDDKAKSLALWLGGVYDGEGCGAGIGQSRSHNPEVCDKIERAFDVLGLPWTYRDGNGASYFIRRAGHAERGKNGVIRQHLVNLMNWGEVVRRQRKQSDLIILGSNFSQRDKVVSIESEGPGEVVSMQTESGNYTAWGYASKNCRMIYLSHPIVSSAIDIYSSWPLQHLELQCKDPDLVDFYSDLFIDQLDYEEFLVDLGREYWLVGEGFALGSFNESLGVWEDDELINPDDVNVHRSPFMREPRYEMLLPQSIRDVITNRSPVHEYNALMRSYPELARYASSGSDMNYMPVSNVLMERLKFKGHAFSERGVPILMRAFRTLLQEEMLNAAFDAVADRLYTPLVLVKLGASATDLGTQSPWIPTQNDITNFNAALDTALAGDFRFLTHHFAVNMQNVLGRETLPRAEQDFARIDGRILQVFGISQTMLSGANKGETYAADALNFELVSQLLARYQRLIKKHYRKRALVVAEAQGHYDYEVRGGKRYPIMEEVLEVDEETGEQRIVEQPKLLIPDMYIRQMNFQSEKDQRAFLESLRASGVPISNGARLVNIPIDLEEERDRLIKEQVEDALAAQRARRETYLALKAAGFPIPEDLQNDFGPKAMAADVPQVQVTPEDQQPLPNVGVGGPTDNSALFPAPLSEDGGEPGTGGAGDTRTLPQNMWLDESTEGGGPKSFERADNMPKASILRTGSKTFTPMPPLTVDDAALTTEVDADGNSVTAIDPRAGNLQFGPRHIGRRLQLDPNVPLDEQMGALT